MKLMNTMGVVLWACLLAFLYLFIKVAYQTLDCYLFTPTRIKNIMSRQGVRGPKPGFLIGNLLDIAALVSKSTSFDMPTIDHDIVTRLLPHFVLWSKIYGKRFIYWNGTEPRMCLTDTELIKELLVKHSTISGKSWLQQQGSKHFIGRGLLMANGQDWHHQRHIVAPAFFNDKLKSYASYMVECTMEMIQSMKAELEKGRVEFEIGECMARLTADIISRTEFDSSYEKGKQIFRLLTDLQQLCAQASRHLCLPGSRFFPSKYNREIKSLKMEVERLLMEIIQSRTDCVEIGRSSSYGDDLLGMLLNEMRKKRGGNGFSLNLQVIMDECKTFFFAGHETTALLLTWTIMLLASNPSWQDKVRAEVREVCNGRSPSVEDLSKLSVLNMVIKESLRLYPPASLLPRMAFEDIKLGDLQIPKGLSIWIPVLAIHHNKEIWGEDVNEFNPSRFAAQSFSQQRHFMPFAAGPRNCVGQSFALMEAKIILSMLICKFNFTIADSYRHAPVIVLTIKPKYGVQVCLKPLEE
ncbi:putative cytochrome P450 [Helianthus annuus]|uniref:Cytochrome P450 n=1 Tax=Helianthus annuus TaxID=4232 RepID=A0A251T3K1_HELAN|nr:cytokinin hydroxylase [Helianthus annuus]KAF5778702.1 putative cytochrome P450 [Helianthus annuus]KAJ0494147.1 putative cytochrome P450 [Helianthus annuus]KAJ0505976.1 putative cytochrome P450 [Helianthus annuus]KAJ0675647.1 putative cytochrome P450 [Helianthus annuus]KAJ0863447.1 putative cytochrome P450 [Helianthus annuus]